MNNHLKMGLLGIAAALTTTLEAEAQTYHRPKHGAAQLPPVMAHLRQAKAVITPVVVKMPTLKFRAASLTIDAKLSRGTTRYELSEIDMSDRKALPEIPVDVHCYMAKFRHNHKGTLDDMRVFFADANHDGILEGTEAIKIEENEDGEMDWRLIGMAVATNDNTITTAPQATSVGDQVVDTTAATQLERDLWNSRDVRKYLIFAPPRTTVPSFTSISYAPTY